MLPYPTFSNMRSPNIPILCYHNFNPSVSGSMNMTPEKFEAQLKWLKENGFTVISLKEAVEFLEGKRNSLPAKPIVITADDGWESAYTYLYPLAKKYNIPVTLFVYPETISAGKHAMTWEELRKLEQTGLFNVQAHTLSHPNFKHERRNRSAASYAKFVTAELVNSKRILEENMGHPIEFLAWPFGIYDSYLEEQASKAGYKMAFSIDARSANSHFRSTSEPRFMMIQGQSMKTFQAIAKGQM